MAYFEPNGILRLCKDVESCEGHRITFSSKQRQHEYFMSKSIMSFDDLSYIHHDGKIMIEAPMATVETCNYIMFENPTEELNAWYAEIIDRVWVNAASTVEIVYKLDEFQNDMFNFEIFDCEMAQEQLSENKWNLALNNPFDPSIIELSTPESIAIGEQFEPIYDNVPLSTGKNGFETFPKATGLTHMWLLMQVNFGWIGGLTEEQSNLWNNAKSKIHDLLEVDLNVQAYFPTLIGAFAVPYASIQSMKDLTDLLTLWGVTSEMVGMNFVHEDFIDIIKAGASPWKGTEINIGIFKTYRHPKLCRFPFQYIRVTSPSGVNKEYQYEYFASAVNGESSVKLLKGANPNGAITEYIVPIGYKFNNPSDYDFSNANINERIEFGDIPQVGYNIDAYLTYLSSQYNSAIASNNAANQYRMSRSDNAVYKGLRTGAGYIDNVIGGVSSLIGSIIGGGTSPVGGILDATIEGEASARGSVENINIMQEATRYMRTTPGEAKESSALSYAKDAYVADAYVPGGATGYIPYQFGLGTPIWRITKVTPNESYTSRIEDYFLKYGCTSTRIGNPYIYEFMRGGSEVPHWTSNNGHMSTYCRVSSCSIKCNRKESADYIKRVFTDGCEFIYGG